MKHEPTRSERCRLQERVAQPTRRKIIRAFGGAALLGPLFGWGCSSDPTEGSQETSTDNLAYAPAGVCGKNDKPGGGSVILFVPGFTVLSINKLKYFKSQREHFFGNREILYLNTPAPALCIPFISYCDYRDFDFNSDIELGFSPDFDSDRKAIKANAAAIGKVLRELGAQNKSVTIVSHSKGGQDVLHALISGSACQELWPIVKGWVAFTSNFFESEFSIEGSSGGSPPGDQVNIFDNNRVSLERVCGSRYLYYHVDPPSDGFEPFVDRQSYMRVNRSIIGDLTNCVPILSAYAQFIPNSLPQLPLSIDRFNWRIQKQSDRLGLCGVNDGIAPARAAQLTGAMFNEALPEDSSASRSGVDHLGPASLSDKFWSAGFRNTKTKEYIDRVENVPIKPTAIAGPDQTVECDSHEGASVKLDGSASRAYPREIVEYEWFENGDQLIAMGSNPTVVLSLGVHEITLKITDSCGGADEDIVVITVEDTLPPIIFMDVNPTILWSPNHKMQLVARQVYAVDLCDPNPSLNITVTSNEPINNIGDGNTKPDWEVRPNSDGSLDVWVRAERRGNGEGRIYTITATVVDGSGNSASITENVSVAHDQSPNI